LGISVLIRGCSYLINIVNSISERRVGDALNRWLPSRAKTEAEGRAWSRKRK